MIDELTKHMLKRSRDAVKEIQENINALKNLQISNIPDFNLSALTQSEINKKYEALQKSGLITILSSDNIKISRIMKRYIVDKKPFAEGKESFRDYALFCTCADYICNKRLSNCYFISENSHDFANKNKSDFHDDLKTESQGMKYVAGLREFNALPEVQKVINEIQAEEEYESLVEYWIQSHILNPVERTTELIADWAIKNIEINKYLYNLFNTKLYNSLENELIDKCMNSEPEVFGEFYDAGYVDYDGIDTIEEVKIMDFTASEDGSVTISGWIKLEVQVSIYAFNWCYERDDEDDSRYICLESGDVGMEFLFDLTLDKDDNFDIYFDFKNLKSDLGKTLYE